MASPSAAARIAPPAPPRVRTAIVLEQAAPGSWLVTEITLADGKVTGERVVERAYYRDLAEQAAAKALRKVGRR